MNTSMYTSSELKEMIDRLEYMNDDDVKAYGFDTVEEAKEQLWEDYEEAIEQESEYENDFLVHGFNSSYEYYSYRF